MKPTPAQIKKFLEYLSEIEKFRWLHIGDQKADHDLVTVVEWLDAMTGGEDE